MDGKSVAVKTISHDCIENFDAFKYVCPFPCSKRLITSVSVWALTETVHQCGHVETITASKCS